KENFLVHWCKGLYKPALEKALRYRKLVLVSAVVALAISLGFGTRLGTEFLPELNEGSIWINFNLPPTTSLAEATHQLHSIRQALMAFPEVNNVISKCGRPEDGTDPKMVNMAEVLVDLKPEKQWKQH